MLDQVPGRRQLAERVEALFTARRVSAPEVRGDRYFYTVREGGQGKPLPIRVREAVDHLSFMGGSWGSTSTVPMIS